MGDCLLYQGNVNNNGYARVTFWHRGASVAIDAHRLFLILKICTPIPLGLEAGHTKGCQHRNCVRHVELQHYGHNANTNGKKQDDTQPGTDCPF